MVLRRVAVGSGYDCAFTTTGFHSVNAKKLAINTLNGSLAKWNLCLLNASLSS